jgi:hypothetical protein
MKNNDFTFSKIDYILNETDLRVKKLPSIVLLNKFEDDPIYIQSFDEESIIKILKKKTGAKVLTDEL